MASCSVRPWPCSIARKQDVCRLLGDFRALSWRVLYDEINDRRNQHDGGTRQTSHEHEFQCSDKQRDRRVHGARHCKGNAKAPEQAAGVWYSDMPCRRRSAWRVCYTSAVRRIRGRAWLLALGSGVLQVLIFPSPSLPWLAWIALAPLIVAVLHPYANCSDAAALLDFRPASARHGFLLGYVSGFVWYAGSCYWIFHVMNTYGGLSAPIAVGVLILFCLYLGLYHGLFGLLLLLVARD